MGLERHLRPCRPLPRLRTDSPPTGDKCVETVQPAQQYVTQPAKIHKFKGKQGQVPYIFVFLQPQGDTLNQGHDVIKQVNESESCSDNQG